jgi:hypothetical protein
MTVQVPESLQNDYPRVDLGKLQLYAIVTGDPLANHGWGVPYPFRNTPQVPEGPMCSALWRGFIAAYHLTSEGTIRLVAYSYPFAAGRPRSEVNEQLEGDFWLKMKPHFKGPSVYIPFLSGVIVADKSRWVLRGDVSLDSLIHPPIEPKKFQPKNVPIESPVFLGIVKHTAPHVILEEDSCICLDREVLKEHLWCAIHIVRDGSPAVTAEIGGHTLQNDLSGIWHVCEPLGHRIEIGDQIWAIERIPNKVEIVEQKRNFAP